MVHPFAGAALFDFLDRHRVAGVETGDVDDDGTAHYARSVRLPHGPGVVRLRWDGARLTADPEVDPRDQDLALSRVRHLVDADADVRAVDARLGADPVLGELVRRTPGLRVPGVLEPAEMVFRTVIGQQISLASARTSAGTIAARYGDELATGHAGLTRLFPTAAALAAVDPAALPMPRSRGRTIVALAERLTDGRIDLDDPDPTAVRASLLACPGIGPWTADYVLMRVCHAPDVLLTTDLVLARELVARGVADSAAWSPYRSYAALHLWHAFLNPA